MYDANHDPADYGENIARGESLTVINFFLGFID